MSEPLITWNLFVTPFITTISTGLIILFVKNLFIKRDKKDERISELLREQEEAKQEFIEDFKIRIDSKLEEISINLSRKVPWDHCTERRQQRDSELRLLEQSVKLAETSDIENTFAHTALGVTLNTIQHAVKENTENDIKVRDILFDKLSQIDVTLKLINGSVRDTKEALAVHIAKGHD